MRLSNCISAELHVVQPTPASHQISPEDGGWKITNPDNGHT